MALYWFRCPNGHLGRIDGQQLRGRASIVCDECDFHGSVDEGEVA